MFVVPVAEFMRIGAKDLTFDAPQPPFDEQYFETTCPGYSATIICFGDAPKEKDNMSHVKTPPPDERILEVPQWLIDGVDKLMPVPNDVISREYWEKRVARIIETEREHLVALEQVKRLADSCSRLATNMDPDGMRRMLTMAIGEASTCWVGGGVPSGVFDDKRALAIVDRLVRAFEPGPGLDTLPGIGRELERQRNPEPEARTHLDEDLLCADAE